VGGGGRARPRSSWEYVHDKKRKEKAQSRKVDALKPAAPKEASTVSGPSRGAGPNVHQNNKPRGRPAGKEGGNYKTSQTGKRHPPLRGGKTVLWPGDNTPHPGNGGRKKRK